MSFKTFVEKVEAEAKKLFGSTTWENTLSSGVSYTAPFLEVLVGLAAGQPAEQLVAAAVNTAQADLATIKALVSGAMVPAGSPALAVVKAALNSLQSNLGGLLSVAEVKNSKTSTQITSVVNTIVGEANALLARAPSATPAPAAA